MIIFATDQHHLGGLEEKVILPYGKNHTIRLFGDITPTQMPIVPGQPEDTYMKRKRKETIKRLKKYGPLHEEPTVEQKIAIDRINISEEKDEEFVKNWVCFYGGASISNLARKYFISSHVAEPVICLRGSEPIIDSSQINIFERLNKDYGIRIDKITKFVLESIRTKQPQMFSIISDQLAQSGVKEDDISKFILRELYITHYNSVAPLCSNVYEGKPALKNFRFSGDMQWEHKENSVLVYVPYFNNYAEQSDALQHLPELEKFVAGNHGHVVIAYHGNPLPEKMDDESCKKKVDYNLPLITAVAKGVLTAAQSGRHSRSVRMLCGHLHKENTYYDWEIFVDSKKRMIRLYPLGVQQIAMLDAAKGNLEVVNY